MEPYETFSDVAEAVRAQSALRDQLDLTNSLPTAPEFVAGLDVSYEVDSRYAAAAAVLIELRSLEVRETAIAYGEVTFPYVPGLLAFREVPILREALGKLAGRPDVLVCDGYGIAHPRRFGLACHMGVLTGLPSFGVAKSPFGMEFVDPGPRRGDWSPIVDDGEVLGRVLRTQAGVKPVFVSVGHRVGLDQATEVTLKLSREFRLPEAIRKADFLSRQELRRRQGVG
ncbi:endonuclease V [Microbispora triticiradicis]|uniref:Endonuclease V n=2 Tax=Microbispora TaxID=2005 RepID=A0ABY3LQP4_9ACTN|nr:MULTISPECIES: endonuclease V [Microbispora]TLP54832.1 endonuclease V [Microbispora fusca]TYB50127.1 endonuclease V [Microbispora tritici]